MKTTTRTVARTATEAQPSTPLSATAALQQELKRRVEAKEQKSPPRSSSIREALTRWLDEQL